MQTWFTRIASPKLSIILMICIAFFLAAATFFENGTSSVLAKKWFYNHPAFFLLLFFSFLNLTAVLIQGRYFHLRKGGMLLLHIGFVVVMIGALITHYFGSEGYLHIREGESSSSLIRTSATQEASLSAQELPFEVSLKDFRLIRYAGSHTPSSYESDLMITDRNGESFAATIYVNKVIHHQGYRLYQSSFDPDEQGTILSVNYDPYGMGISYVGYFLIFIGILWLLLGKGSRFVFLRQQLFLPKGKTLLVAGLLLCCFSLWGETQQAKLYPDKEQAALLGDLIIQSSSGRIEPVNTYAASLIRKITKTSSWENATPEQMLLSMMLYPTHWNQQTIIYQPNAYLQQMLSAKGKYISFNALFDSLGRYKLSPFIEEAYRRSPKERSPYDKDLLKLDEKANIIYALQEGNLFPIFPLSGNPSGQWFSPGDSLSLFRGQDSIFVSRIFAYYMYELHGNIQSGDYLSSQEAVKMIKTYQQSRAKELFDTQRLKAEMLYNRLNIFERLPLLYLISSLILVVLSLISLSKSDRWLRWTIGFLSIVIASLFLVHAFGIGLRWYAAGQPPLANAYESMVFVGCVCLLGGLIFARRSPLTLGLSGLMGGITLFVAHLHFMDPQITPLVPVLKSPWLMIHVAVIISGYSFFGISFLLSAVYLMTQEKTLKIINELSLIIGLCLMTAGTFLGAIWANESWGRYWAWDPKETWALITMIVYAIVLHLRFIRTFKSEKTFHLLIMIAFASVLMTYFGVNYFFSGLHSYLGK